jgi:hypothetical protein
VARHRRTADTRLGTLPRRLVLTATGTAVLVVLAGTAAGTAVPQPLLHRAAALRQPLSTIATGSGRGGGHQALIVPYYTKGVAHHPAEPLGAISTQDRFALVSAGQLAEKAIDDCHLRMLWARENAHRAALPRRLRSASSPRALRLQRLLLVGGE